MIFPTQAGLPPHTTHGTGILPSSSIAYAAHAYHHLHQQQQQQRVEQLHQQHRHQQQQQQQEQHQQQQHHHLHHPLMMNPLPCFYAPAHPAAVPVAGYPYPPMHYPVIPVPTATTLPTPYGMAPPGTALIAPAAPTTSLPPPPMIMAVPAQATPLFSSPPPPSPPASMTISSTIQLIENSHELRLTMDLPGVRSNHVRISMTEDPVTKEGIMCVRALRKITSFDGRTCLKRLNTRQVFGMDLETVDIENLKAKLQDGVLIVTAPKRQHQPAGGKEGQEQQEHQQFTPRDIVVEAPTPAAAAVDTASDAFPEEQRSSHILPMHVPSAATIGPAMAAGRRHEGRTHKRVVSDYDESDNSNKRQRR